MKILKRLYIYWFCSFYKVIESSWLPIAPVFRATGLMIAFEIFLLSIIFVSFLLYTRVYIPLGNPYYFSIPVVVVLAIIKYIIFDHNHRWKGYITMFESFPINKRRKILFFSWVFNIVVFVSFIGVFILLSKIEWKN